jgi:hypothetical protein
VVPGGPPPGGGYAPPQAPGYGQAPAAPAPAPANPYAAQAPMPGAAPPAPAAGSWASAPGGEKGFIASLFDFSFSSFITTKLMKVIYGVLLFAALLGAFAVFMAGVSEIGSRYGSAARGVLFIILSPIAAVLYVILARLYCELIVVLFRIAESVRDINRKTKE